MESPLTLLRKLKAQKALEPSTSDSTKKAKEYLKPAPVTSTPDNLEDHLRELYAAKVKEIEICKSKEVSQAIKSWQSPDDCKGCRCLIPWPNYPFGGGTKYFCVYWILELGKAKKVELSKLTICPKGEILKKVA